MNEHTMEKIAEDVKGWHDDEIELDTAYDFATDWLNDPSREDIIAEFGRKSSAVSDLAEFIVKDGEDNFENNAFDWEEAFRAEMEADS